MLLKTFHCHHQSYIVDLAMNARICRDTQGISGTATRTRVAQQHIVLCSWISEKRTMSPISRTHANCYLYYLSASAEPGAGAEAHLLQRMPLFCCTSTPFRGGDIVGRGAGRGAAAGERSVFRIRWPCDAGVWCDQSILRIVCPHARLSDARFSARAQSCGRTCWRR